jgi:non-heme chloroperoxidase
VRSTRYPTVAAAILLILAPVCYAQLDSSRYSVQLVSVARDVKLEVVDWGGTGRAFVLIPGLGDTAHVFDHFALKLTPSFHVYGITPRGFGASSTPPPEPRNYSSSRLGEDVVAIIDSLKLDRPVLAGHSIAGEVLSEIATHHSDKVSALIYIDAGYSYALYDKAHGDLVLDSIALRDNLDESHLGTLPRSPKQIDALLTQLARMEQELRQRKNDLSQLSSPHPIDNPTSVAVLDGQQKYTQIDVPVLAIFNVPHSPAFRRTMEDQARAFQIQVPHARIIRIPNADHYIFQSNEQDVLRDIGEFMAGLRIGE